MLVQFWQIADEKPLAVRLFEEDGVTMFRTVNGSLRVIEEKRAYQRTVLRDSLG